MYYMVLNKVENKKIILKLPVYNRIYYKRCEFNRKAINYAKYIEKEV